MSRKSMCGACSADPERTAFEEHYFLCPKCLEELRLWSALQQAAVPVAERRPAANLYVWAAAAASRRGYPLLRILAAFGTAGTVVRDPGLFPHGLPAAAGGGGSPSL